MNKKFQELAKQAGMRKCSLGYGQPENVLWGEFQIEQFAELIVQECLDTCDKTGRRENSPYGAIAWDCIDDIKTHFGIK